jgi:hypothetical protein
VHKLIIQPFVENAIVHGFDTKRETYTLKVSMLAEGGRVAITIADNGKGISPEILEALGSGDVKEIRTRPASACQTLSSACTATAKGRMRSVYTVRWIREQRLPSGFRSRFPRRPGTVPRNISLFPLS